MQLFARDCLCGPWRRQDRGRLQQRLPTTRATRRLLSGPTTPVSPRQVLPYGFIARLTSTLPSYHLYNKGVCRGVT
ncbi:hypothetical protein LC1Hm_1361 [Halomicrobium sp. LC1Hm]|nr:hypothetical protein LC1Hm_1361 [Halomicrobium sp. LC1Hm]